MKLQLSKWWKSVFKFLKKQSRPQGIMPDQNLERRYLENDKSFFKNLKTDFHHFESWEIIIFYAGIPLRRILWSTVSKAFYTTSKFAIIYIYISKVDLIFSVTVCLKAHNHLLGKF